jgi:LacI family transcriptional regulator
VVSFDGSDLAGWLRPPLTSVVIPYERLGSLAFDRLMSGASGVAQLPMPVREGASVR